MSGSSDGWRNAAQATASFESCRLLSVAQVASLLSISPRSVWRKVSSHDLPNPIRLGTGRLVRWRLSDLAALVKGGESHE
jgi:predicted DNA-binding transcriptional regulator AlpA